MCLDGVDSVTFSNVTHGYKVFGTINNMILGEYYNHDGTVNYEIPITPYQIGEWYKARDYTIKEDGISYPTGFHTFLYKEDAEDWIESPTIYKVFKVEISDIVASGYQHFRGKKRAIIVSKRMKIIEES